MMRPGSAGCDHPAKRLDEQNLDDDIDPEDVDSPVEDDLDEELEEDLDEELDDDVLPADDDDDVVAPVVDDDEEEDVPVARRKPAGEDEDEDDDELDPDDVEADLDAILKDRIAAGSDDDEDDEDEATDDRNDPDTGERVAAKSAEEFTCTTCFMIVHPRQFGRAGHLECPEGYDPCPSITVVEKRLKKAAKK